MSFQDLVAAAQLNAAANRNAFLQRLEQARIETKVLGSPVSRVGQAALMPIVTKPWRPTRPQKEYSPAPNITLPFALAWRETWQEQDSNGFAVYHDDLYSGDGSQRIAVPDLPIPPTPAFTGMFTAVSVTQPWTYNVNSNPMAANLTPYGTSFWFRQQQLSAAELHVQYRFTSTHNTNDAYVLPIGKDKLIYVLWRPGMSFNTHFLLRAALEPGQEAQDSFLVREEVEGSSGEDPEALMNLPSRRKRILIVIPNKTVASLSVKDSLDVVTDVSRRYAAIIGKSTVRSLEFPSVLDQRLEQFRGTIPTTRPTNQVVYQIGERYRCVGDFNGIKYHDAFFSNASTRFTGVYYYVVNQFPDPAVDPESGYVLENSPIRGFGLALINDDYAQLGGYGGTPLLYRVLDGSSSVTKTTFWDTDDRARPLMDVHLALAPLPRKYMWISVVPESSNPNDPYLSTTPLVFHTYRNAASNARADGTWQDFKQKVGEDYSVALPNVPGNPARLTYQLAKDRQPLHPGSFSMFFSLATTYGEDVYCRTKLLELGFTAEDLNPTPPTP